MKKNTTERVSGGHGALVAVGVVLLAAAAAAIAFAYTYLRDVWREQCVIDDVPSQVTVHDGKLVKGDVVADALGLRKGANLAEIDFAKRRADVLARYPAIRDLTVTRHLPNRVEISIEEREPVVRMNVRGHKGDTGRVADTDGVVFISSSGTQMLPLIWESTAPGTAKGQRLGGAALGALVLLETCRDQFRELNVIEADVSKSDHIVIVLGTDYSRATIDWPGRENPSEATKADLVERLTNLRHSYTSRVDDSIREWDATQPGVCTGNTKRKLL